MISKTNIIAAAKNIARHNRGYHTSSPIHPRRDWWIGLTMFAVIVLSGSLYLAQLFVKYQQVEDLKGEAVLDVPKYQETAVDHALENYENRSAFYADALLTLPVVSETVTTTTEEVDSVTEDILLDGEVGTTTAEEGEE